MKAATDATARYDAVVVGAGPYGLSTAAHLLGRGLRVAVFGKPAELWRDHMPRGMLLRSHAWATSLSGPGGGYGFDRFLRSSRGSAAYPVPRDAFIEYSLWFQERAVPNVEPTYVTTIDRLSDGFRLTLASGRQVSSATVVMATGLHAYARRPQEFSALPAQVSHACDHTDLECFRGLRVIVVGGGQSAIEYAALLHESGARVRVVARRPIVWLAPDPGDDRPLHDRLRAPDASLAPGWKNWVLDRVPYLFYRFAQERKDRANRNYYTSAASDWLRPRIVNRVHLDEAQTIIGIEPANQGLDVRLSTGETARVDRVLLATGYQPDVDKLTMLAPSLRTAIEADNGIPALNAWFESSVPGLYFVGLTSLRAFGPLYRFVAGCGASATRVTRSITRHVVRGPARASARSAGLDRVGTSPAKEPNI